MLNIQINKRLKDIKGCKEDFGGVGIIAIGDLFQLQPVMDGHVFKDLNDYEYGPLAPNLWQKHFQMFELTEIMRQRKQRICRNTQQAKGRKAYSSGHFENKTTYHSRKFIS